MNFWCVRAGDSHRIGKRGSSKCNCQRIYRYRVTAGTSKASSLQWKMHLSEVSSANAMFPAFQLIHPTPVCHDLCRASIRMDTWLANGSQGDDGRVSSNATRVGIGRPQRLLFPTKSFFLHSNNNFNCRVHFLKTMVEGRNSSHVFYLDVYFFCEIEYDGGHVRSLFLFS